MTTIKTWIRQIIRGLIFIIPRRILSLIITFCLEAIFQKEEKEDKSVLLESRDSIANYLEAISQREPKLAIASLLELEDRITNYINQVAVKYDNGIHVKHRLMKYHDFFTDRIQEGDRVLDIGCGNGSLAYDIAVKSRAIVTGIDLNSQSIDFAQKRFNHPNLTFIQGDALTDNIVGTFEVIVLSNILEHIENRIKFLQSIQENFKPKVILIRVPMFDRHWLVPLRKELGLFYFSDATHYTEYTQQSFEEELKSANLQIQHWQINWGEIWSEAIIKND